MKLLYSVVIAGLTVATFGCARANTNTGNTNTNQNADAMNASKAAQAPTPAIEMPVLGSSATPSDAYRTAYAIREKKDVAGMKRIMSKDVIDFLTMIGKEEKKTLDEEIVTIFDRPQAKTAEIRNEKISGERATIEYLDGDGKWKTMDFEKEGGDWKLSLPAKEDIEVESGAPDKKR